MSSNQKFIYENYGDGLMEDGRANWSRSSEIEFYYTKKHISEFINKDSRVLEIGCATGYYAMHFAERCKEYIGVDIVPEHIEIFKKKIAENKLSNVSTMVGDVTNLSEINDNSFDVVLCLGPMYHLPVQERELAYAECKRISRQGGVVVFAYINKVGAYVGACVHDECRKFYPNKKANKYILEFGTDDLKPDVFFFTMPEEMEEAAQRHGFTKIKNVGTDFFITKSIVDKMDDEKFSSYMELADHMSNYESCTGMSNHALLICKS